jgi:hypothetical protein
MPRGDRSGPGGAGPMTGRGLGYCAGYPAPGYAADGYGYGRGGGGYGGGRGGGRGYRHRYYATGVPGWGRAGYPAAYGPPAGYAPPDYAPPGGYAPPVAPPLREDAAVLKAEAEYLAAALEETRSRLAALESDNDE